MRTSDTWESVLTRDKTLRKPVNGVPQKHTKVNSLVNDTLKKALNRAPLTQGKLNSQVNETLKKLLKRVPTTHGKVYSLEIKH